jgi:hypothetical protein
MGIFSKLERRLSPYAPPNVTVLLIALQVSTFVLGMLDPQRLLSLYLLPDRVMAGEWWRVFTFLALPPFTNPICAFFFFYLFHLMGTTLERTWGTFRYDLFLLIGYIATVVTAFILPEKVIQNGFLQGSVFLAFAWLYPTFTLSIFFVLPIQIRYLALIQWVFYGIEVINGRYEALAGVVNFFCFFGVEVLTRARNSFRRMQHESKRVSTEQSNAPFHRCTVCGITEKSNPEMEFRYCSKCYGTCGYCSRHLHAHEHVQPPAEATTT